MCAIVGSRNINKLNELVDLNSYRGSHSYSFSLYNYYLGTMKVCGKGLGKITDHKDYSSWSIPSNHYGIVHVQAPTSDMRDDSRIHPANLDEDFLWHNGILKANSVKSLSETYGTTWDTMQILYSVQSGWDALGELDGTFSCLYYDNTTLALYMFRNEISPMFIDDDMNISSTKFEGSTATPANQVLRFDLNNKQLVVKHNFETVENPYYFGE